MNHFIKNKSNQVAFAFAALLITYASLVWPALNGPFLFDDFPNLKNLNQISGTFSWTNIGNYLAAFVGTPGRPISALSFLINDYAWPSEPFSFKYTNLLLHLLNGVLVFGLIRKLAKSTDKLPQNLFWPLIAMAAWLIHPLQLSAQMLVVQRMTLLSATFSFAGLWAYVSLLQKTENPLGALIALASLCTATILAILSKENGALLPLFALVLNVTLLADLLQKKSKAVQHLVFFCCAIPAALVLIAIVYTGTIPGAYMTREFVMHERLLTEIHILMDYLNQVFMPHISGSGIYHDNYPITKTLFSSFSTLVFAVFIAGIIGSAVLFRKKFPLLSFATLWFFAGHAMESTTIALELYFEHRNYIPLLGPVMALTALPFLVAVHLHKIASILLGAWLIIISLITYVQAPVWGNHALMVTLWAKEKPMSLRATYELAQHHYKTGQRKQAFDILINGYNRGINAADLPFAAIYTACWNSEIHISEDLMEKSINAAKTGFFTHGAILHLSRLRPLASTKQCPRVITIEQWWQLSDAMLANNKFKFSFDSIHLERAQYRIDSKDFANSLLELEAAYQLKPTLALSYEIAVINLSGGNDIAALSWLKNGLDLKRDRLKKMLSTQDEKKSEDLIKLIESARVESKK